MPTATDCGEGLNDAEWKTSQRGEVAERSLRSPVRREPIESLYVPDDA
jgi:hypothetical protein